MKKLIRFLWNKYLKYIAFFLDDCYCLVVKKLDVKSREDTIQNLIQNKSSICRYGDGEFQLAMGKSIPFQKYDSFLQEKLLHILRSEESDILVGIPGVFNGLSDLEKIDKDWWRVYLCKNRRKIYKLLNKKRVYYDANMSRPYMIFKDKRAANKIFDLFKKLWDKRSLIIIEGEKSRLGVGNDLFDNTYSVRRILCPAVDAFSRYSVIIEVVKNTYCKGDLVLHSIRSDSNSFSL